MLPFLVAAMLSWMSPVPLRSPASTSRAREGTILAATTTTSDLTHSATHTTDSAASVLPSNPVFERIRSLIVAMRDTELPRDAPDVGTGMGVADLHAELRAARLREMASAGSSVVAEMELIDAQRCNEQLAQENDQLQTSLRQCSTAYCGRPASHHLALVTAHGRTAALAVASDVRWGLKAFHGRVKAVIKRFLFVLAILRVRFGMRVIRLLANLRRA